jgi:mono/diheme cytochrome c family protein
MRALEILFGSERVKLRALVRTRALPAIAAALLLVLPAAQVLAGPGQSEKNGSAPAGDKDAGKKFFLANGCYSCHGREGQGATQATGPRIGPPLLSFEGFVSYIHHPTGQMPPYTEKVVSEKELADIYAYLQSRPKPKAGKDIPLLNE